MSTPHQCPKCGGLGWLQYDPNSPFGSSTVTGPWMCPPCGTTGIIWSHPDNQTSMEIKPDVNYSTRTLGGLINKSSPEQELEVANKRADEAEQELEHYKEFAGVGSGV